METIQQIDRVVFLALNGLHTPLLDPLMYWGTRTLTWIPLFLLLLFLTIRQYKRKVIWLLLGVVLVITLSDQTSNIAKQSFQRLRPSHEPTLEATVHLVNGYRGGTYGFYSAHASNTMAIAIFLILLLKTHYRWIALLMIPWALFMAYTRLYLGVHYPFDLLAGMVVGGVVGWIGAQACGYLISRNAPRG